MIFEIIFETGDHPEGAPKRRLSPGNDRAKAVYLTIK
jgi:hypothetical protein